jgi:nucleoid-associated protein YgaU
MAREYEVREEFQSYSLGQLMDSPVTCFQGMGDIQAEMLKQYFGITTIKDMANFRFFLWASAIQEAALDSAMAGRKVGEIATGPDARFQVREEYRQMTPVELMNAPIHALEGLTPAQDLALYDIFRITNITHLAHNRIMLEARVIQVLESQSGEAGAVDEVDSVLGRRTASAAATAVQRITEGRRAGRDDRLAALEKETTEHIRGRLESLREQARARASSLPSREGGTRLTSIQQSKERAESASRLGELAAGGRLGTGERRAVAVTGRRITTVATVGRASAGPMRGAPARSMDSRTAAVVAARGVAPRVETASASRAAAVSAARSGTAPFRGGGGGGGAVYRGGGGGGAAPAQARPAAVAAAPKATPSRTTEEAVKAGAAAAGGTPKPAPARRGFQPWMAVAAVVALVLLVLIIWFAVQPAFTPPSESRTAGNQAPSSGTVPGTAAPATGTQPGTATTGAQPGTTAPAAGAAVTTSATPKPEVAIRATHEVKSGESLWRISKFYYQLGHVWRRIFSANEDQIKNPDLIYPKQKFKIPE